MGKHLTVSNIVAQFIHEISLRFEIGKAGVYLFMTSMYLKRAIACRKPVVHEGRIN